MLFKWLEVHHATLEPLSTSIIKSHLTYAWYYRYAHKSYFFFHIQLATQLVIKITYFIANGAKVARILARQESLKEEELEIKLEMYFKQKKLLKGQERSLPYSLVHASIHSHIRKLSRELHIVPLVAALSIVSYRQQGWLPGWQTQEALPDYNNYLAHAKTILASYLIYVS